MVCYFISGQLDNSQWPLYYEVLSRVLQEDQNTFVVGDAKGIDAQAQQYLADTLPLDQHKRVTVYHMFLRPRYCSGAFLTRGGFTTDAQRDAAMTQASDMDIAFLEPLALTQARLGPKYRAGYISGTEANLRRRLAAKSR